MARLRKLFLLLALALALPVGLLVERALSSVGRERDAYHAAVASRVFDEMERVLSEVLNEEEERPFGHYQHEYVADAAAGLTPAAQQRLGKVRSPLAELPAERWLLGHFEIDFDGSFRTPLRATAPGWQAAPAVDVRIAELERLVRRAWPSSRAEPDASEPRRHEAIQSVKLGKKLEPPTAAWGPKAGDRQEQEQYQEDESELLGQVASAMAPGSTVALEATAGKDKQTWQANELPVRKDSLASLNRGASGRTRNTKVAQTAAPNIAAYDAAPEGEKNAAAPDASAPPRASRAAAPERRGPAGAASKRQGLATPEPPPAPKLGPVDVSLEPMVAKLVNPSRLLLYRSVWIDGRAIRQGAVLDVGELARWLVDGTVGLTELAEHVAVDLSSSPTPPAQDGYVFHHRFAEPFSDLRAALAIAPLPDAVQPTYVYGLALALLVAGAAGLFALYRMTASVVSFAQRRNDFVSAVTHELKTPLTSIRMYGEMLQEDMVASEEKRREYYRSITGETERLSRLIDNVLELSRLEKGTRQVRLVAGPAADVLREAVAFFAPQAQREGFELVLDLPESMSPVLHDRDALVQVLFNLIDNALKYARGAARKQIVITCRQDAGRVLLTVRDHGPGVAEAKVSKIFEPFYRAQDELTRTAKGTGIGLALVKGLVEKMNGQVAGRNVPDGGFEVMVALPAAR